MVKKLSQNHMYFMLGDKGAYKPKKSKTFNNSVILMPFVHMKVIQCALGSFLFQQQYEQVKFRCHTR